jgi:hypothetical protein
VDWAALVTWVLTAGGGFFLLAIWLRHGGVARAREQGNRIRPPLLFTHFGLAATGLVLWIVYIATDSDALAWIAFALLLVVALLGFTMFGIWLSQRSRRTATSVETDPPEQQFPLPVVALHGVLAATTLVLVLLSAAGVGS